MDDRTALERALENLRTDLHSITPAPMEISLPLDGTPWTRWKAASCDLVNWAAARIMRALYIAPFRVCLQNVHASSRQNETPVVNANAGADA